LVFCVTVVLLTLITTLPPEVSTDTVSLLPLSEEQQEKWEKRADQDGQE
jgi:hypothetical protein